MTDQHDGPPRGDNSGGYSETPNKWLNGCTIVFLVLAGFVGLFLGTCLLLVR